MLSILVCVGCLCFVGAELWTGIAVMGWTGDFATVERAKSPGPYWFTMALHTLIGIGITALAMFTG
jgi:hypothetical protein